MADHSHVDLFRIPFEMHSKLNSMYPAIVLTVLCCSAVLSLGRMLVLYAMRLWKLKSSTLN
jgi:hypothetical protein